MNNIAEGFVRRRDKELLQFLRYSAASNAEVKTCLYAAEGRAFLESTELRDLIAENESIAKMIGRGQATLRPGARARAGH